jgi:hypothetical protein
MADEEVRRTIRIRGGPLPAAMLGQMMRLEGVRIVSRTAEPEKPGIISLVVEGPPGAIALSLAAFRRRFPGTSVDVQGENGKPSPESPTGNGPAAMTGELDARHERKNDAAGQQD